MSVHFPISDIGRSASFGREVSGILKSFVALKRPETHAAGAALRNLTQRCAKLGEMSRALKIAPASSA
jgi:hypothetical protein